VEVGDGGFPKPRLLEGEIGLCQRAKLFIKWNPKSMPLTSPLCLKYGKSSNTGVKSRAIYFSLKPGEHREQINQKEALTKL
jgi:hypothetical protein